MRFLIATCAMLSIFGCKQVDPQMSMQRIKTCEYIMVRDNHGVSIVHAGDCDSPTHGIRKPTTKPEGMQPINKWVTVNGSTQK